MQHFWFVAAAAAIIVARRIMTLLKSMALCVLSLRRLPLYRQLAVNFFFYGALKIGFKKKAAVAVKAK
jgi:hypothetical protein